MCEDKTKKTLGHVGDDRLLAAYDHCIHVAATAYSEEQHYVISYFQFPHC